jgi:hypothetical protein
MMLGAGTAPRPTMSPEARRYWRRRWRFFVATTGSRNRVEALRAAEDRGWL